MYIFWNSSIIVETKIDLWFPSMIERRKGIKKETVTFGPRVIDVTNEQVRFICVLHQSLDDWDVGTLFV